MERRFVTLVVCAVPGIVVVQLLNTLVRAYAPSLGSTAYLDLAFGVVAASAASILIGSRMPGRTPALLAGALAGTLVALGSMLARGADAFAVALPITGLLTGLAAELVTARLPRSLDGIWNRRRGVALLWLVLALVALAQTGRLGARMADPASPWWLTNELPLWAEHQCIVAYVYAADLNRQGVANVYARGTTPASIPKRRTWPRWPTWFPTIRTSTHRSSCFFRGWLFCSATTS